MTGPRHGHDLTRVAALVLEARAARRPAGKAVARTLNVTIQQAHYLIRQAKDADLIGAGRHQPAPAIVNRNSAHEHQWVCCIHCLVPWPCRTWKAHHSRQDGDGSTDEHANPGRQRGRRRAPGPGAGADR